MSKVYHLRLFVLFVFAVWFTKFIAVGKRCSKQTGPAGTVSCINLTRYYDYQWATCLTDTYIKKKSKGKHWCLDKTATYCYYQCMIEVHHQNDGAVYPDCKCNPNTKPLSTPATLPARCFSPDGSDCSWYRECLEKRYPCEGTSDVYALTYAEKFCELYNKKYSDFSIKAQQWIDAVRKCLEVALVPLLRPWQTPSCEALKKTAFESHSPCYLEPGKNAVSFCDLSLFDQRRVFWTIKGSFSSAFVPSLKGLWKVSSKCFIANPIRSNYTALAKRFSQYKLKVKSLIKDKFRRLSGREGRPISEYQEELDYFAGSVIDAVALRQGWREKGVAWFVFASNETVSSDLITIVTQLADRFTYEAPGSSCLPRRSHFADVNVTLWEMAEAIQKGKFNGLQIGSGRDKVGIVEMKACADWFCNEFSFNVTAHLSTAGKTTSSRLIYTKHSHEPTLCSAINTSFTGFNGRYILIIAFLRLIVTDIGY